MRDAWLGIKLPAVVDRFDDSTGRWAYSGWPDRLYVIDARSAGSPTRASPVRSASNQREMEAALRALLPTRRQTVLRGVDPLVCSLRSDSAASPRRVAGLP